MVDEVLPNFLFIGPDKAGSTWLHQALGRHPQVCLSTAKELFFFDQFYERGWEWYKAYFAQCGQQRKVIGEISHDYLFSSVACDRIARDLPSVKLMVCLREPVQRAFSAYLYMVKQGRVASDFDTALYKIDELIDHARYAFHLRKYLDAFGRDRVHVAIFDDLEESPQLFFDDLCDFLAIDRHRLAAEFEGKVNSATRPRFFYIAGLARKVGWLVRRWGMPGLVGFVKNSAWVNWILYQEYGRDSKPEISDEARKYIRDQLMSEVQDLDAMVGTDLCARWGYPKRADSTLAQP